MKTKAVRVLNSLLEAEKVITYFIDISSIEYKEILYKYNKSFQIQTYIQFE